LVYINNENIYKVITQVVLKVTTNIKIKLFFGLFIILVCLSIVVAFETDPEGATGNTPGTGGSTDLPGSTPGGNENTDAEKQMDSKPPQQAADYFAGQNDDKKSYLITHWKYPDDFNRFSSDQRNKEDGSLYLIKWKSRQILVSKFGL
jgi:hypothetical protein